MSLSVQIDHCNDLVIVTMLAVLAMIRLRAPAIAFVASCAIQLAAPAQNVLASAAIEQLAVAPERMTPSGIARREFVLASATSAEPALRAVARYRYSRNLPVQDTRPQLTREHVLSALGSDDDDIRSGAYIALGLLGERQDLPLLFIALYDNDRLIRKLAEDAIWKVWGRSGNPLHDRMYQRGLEQMQAGRLVGAARSFTALIQLAPEFTEAWNKRATVYFLLGQNDQSIADCEAVLSREPNHFGALSGYGQLMLRKGEHRRALGYFEKALTANPNMPAVERSIETLRDFLRREEGEKGV